MTNNIIEHKPILAKIQLQNSLGLSTWYEVICWDDNIWKRYGDNKYFTNGEQVIEWKYCEDCFKYYDTPIAYFNGVYESRYTINWNCEFLHEGTPLYCERKYVDESKEKSESDLYIIDFNKRYFDKIRKKRIEHS
jgi:hypothetical protein